MKEFDTREYPIKKESIVESDFNQWTLERRIGAIATVYNLMNQGTSFQAYWGDLIAFLRMTCNPQSLARLQVLNDNLYAAVTEHQETVDDLAPGYIRFANANTILTCEALSWIMDSPIANRPARDVWLVLLQRYPNKASAKIKETRKKARWSYTTLFAWFKCVGGMLQRKIRYKRFWKHQS